MEVVHIAPNGDYERYEKLMLQKEELEKEADGYQISYLQQFGELTTKAFEIKVECIAIKKEIALYVLAENSGKKLTDDEIAECLKKQMTAYKEELERMIEENEKAKKAKPISNFTAEQIKKIYRRLAKILHPDISPLTEQYPQLCELFTRVIIAYKCNDLKELQKLEVLINKELEENGIEKFDMVIPNIAERIAELESDIDFIVNSEPYIYKKLLRDEEAVNKKISEINKDIEEYTDYKKELLEILKEKKKGNNNG